MSIFRDMPAEDVARQHQFLIDLLLVAVCSLSQGTRQSMAGAIQNAISLCRETGSDTTILEATLDHILQLPAPEASH
jgi:hypothetical protein